MKTQLIINASKKRPRNVKKQNIANTRVLNFDIAPQVPKIEIQSEGHNFHPLEGEDFSLSYNVTSYPDSDIEWSRSRDGVKYENIATCSLKGGCNKNKEINDLKEDITNTSFEIKDLKFPQDNGYYYKCNASNGYGDDSKVFQLQVYGNAKCVTFKYFSLMSRYNSSVHSPTK